MRFKCKNPKCNNLETRDDDVIIARCMNCGEKMEQVVGPFVHHIKCEICKGDLELESYGAGGSPGFPVCEACFPAWAGSDFPGIPK